MTIVFLAPPAAGKGTHSLRLIKKYNLAHISTGDILREKMQNDDEVAYYLRETLSTGKLVKDEIIYQLLEERFSKSDCQNGYILDGFPRNVEQAIKLDEIQKHIHHKLNYVFLFDIDKEILKKRIIGRRICDSCGAVYNINFSEHAPKMESTCDICGGKLYQRTDDNIASFEVRYQTYLDNVKPIADYYRKKGVLICIDANVEENEVFKQIENAIDHSLINKTSKEENND